MMIITGYVWYYNLNVILIGSLPLDLGYGIPLAGSFILFALFGFFTAWLRKRNDMIRNKSSRLDYRRR